MKKIAPLGLNTPYPNQYDPSLLFPVERKTKRDEIGVVDPLPFRGADIWTGYELSWLNHKGKPNVAIAEFEFTCESPNIIESKSFKLYLNSLNQTRFDSAEQLKQQLAVDLQQAAGSPVKVTLFTLDAYQARGFAQISGRCIDDLDIAPENYDYRPDLLESASKKESTSGNVISECLYSHLLKSNCLITSQPDWATLIIEYRGMPIDHVKLLEYIISYRNHNEFHEQCVERVYQDLMRYCQPEELTVIARYTRRGGLDINPWRSNVKTASNFLRLARQ